MKNKILALVGLVTPFITFAEGEASTMDTAAAKGMVQSAQAGLTSLLTECVPYVTTLFLGGLAIWAAFVIFRLIKRAFSRAA